VVACGDSSGPSGGDGGVKADGPGGKKDTGPKTDSNNPKSDGPVVKFDKGPKPDGIGPVGDGAVGPCDPNIIGKSCTESGGECGQSGTCLLTSAGKGVCGCSCTPDDSSTPLINEDSCPSGTNSVCIEIEVTGGSSPTINLCARKCNPTLGKNDCQAPLACNPLSARFNFVDAVCFYDGCTKDSDCPVTLETVCSVKNPTACASGDTCLALSSGSDVGRCSKAGKCDTASGLCAPHSLGKAGANIGDSCKSDLE
jgi:hypothetical protein